MKNKRLYVILWLLCIFGAWAILPYAQHLGIFPPSVSLVNLYLLVTLQAALAFGIVCWLCYLIVPKTDLNPFSSDRFRIRIIYPGIIAGVAVGLAIFLLEKTLFRSSSLSAAHPPAWTGLLASFYGGINEEVLLRLFFFSLLYFIFKKIFRSKNRLRFLWVTNLIVALAFGIGHLPVVFKLINPSSMEVFRVLLLNGIPGIVFGWLYWSRGLWTAMTAHFVTDLMIHVIL